METKGTTPSREGISDMFDQISSSYDVTNRVMTFGLDAYWRKKVVSFLPQRHPIRVLDCATGTGDQIISLFKHNKNVSSVVGIDLAKDMLAIAQAKLAKHKLDKLACVQLASALEIPFHNNSFDAVTISFGIRNVTDVANTLTEFYRVLNPGGRVIILEGTVPKNRFLRLGHLLYLRHILPRVGGLFSRNKDAYKYLNQTIESFPSGPAFCQLMAAAGFLEVHAQPLTAGSVTIYVGEKL